MNINRVRCDVCKRNECDHSMAEQEGWKKLLILPFGLQAEKRNEIPEGNDPQNQDQGNKEETEDQQTDPEDICPGCRKRFRELKETPAQKTSDNGYEPLSLEDLEERHILATLQHTEWNKSQAAHILEIERSTLDRKLKKYEVERPKQVTQQ